jgi:hypothetical protein
MPMKWTRNSSKKPCHDHRLLCTQPLLFVHLNCIQNGLAVAQHMQQLEAPILDQVLIATCQRGNETLLALSDRLRQCRKPLFIAPIFGFIGNRWLCVARRLLSLIPFSGTYSA